MFESRGFNLFMAFVCYQLLVTAYYFQYVQGMDPCPLCIFQRIGVLAVGIVFLIRGLHNPLAGSRWRPTYSILGLISTILGGIVSGRHIYLQSLPEGEVPACGPALDYLVDMLPVSEVISTVLAGDGECAKVSWNLLGISMPGWVMIFFVCVGGLMIWSIVNHFKPNKNIFRQ
ncbi:MAG: disulfide bond formation protein B [Kangiellaceae bacterium]|nr:disulfide bond formation protein B [Kangiellaceae bacterium]